MNILQYNQVDYSKVKEQYNKVIASMFFIKNTVISMSSLFDNPHRPMVSFTKLWQITPLL